MKIIGIEEHYQPKCLEDHLLSRKVPPRLEITRDKNRGNSYRTWNTPDTYVTTPPEIYKRMRELGGDRLKDMDEMGITMQVLSCPSGLEYLGPSEATALAVKINDEVSLSIGKYPGRFASFATLALNDPAGAAKELERAVKQLGLRGTMITPHVNGEYIDAKKYWPIFEKAAKLDVPIYMHPGHPPADSLQQYAGYPELTGAPWGFAAVTGLAAMRLICSGIFDEYPDLKIILGHMGEALPYWMSRIDNRLLILAEAEQTPRRADGTFIFTPVTTILKKRPSQYILDNFYISTSGVMWPPALLCSHLALGSEKILFAVDYPVESLKDSVQAIETAPISYHDKEKIFHLNAERLFKL